MLRFFDYYLLLLPGLVITIWAQWHILRAYRAGSKSAAASGITGAEVVQAISSASGLTAIEIELARGELSNHYDQSRGLLRLSPRVYDGRSLTALGVAAHEAGHAIQDAAGYAGLIVRNLIVPLAGIGSQLFWLLILAGVFLEMDRLILAGIIWFLALLVLQLVNLPVELDASRRGRQALMRMGVIKPAEEPITVDAMNAAAWTYVASTLTGGLGSGIWRDRSGWTVNGSDRPCEQG